MPGKGTKAHRFRIPDELWNECVRKANRTGIDISTVVRERLAQWVTESDPTTGEQED